MRVLAFSCYYTPEIASSMYLSEDIYAGIIEAGHTLELYVPMPTRGISKDVRREYRKRKSEVKFDGKMIVHRISIFREGKNPLLRAIRYLIVNLAFINKGLHAKADVIFVQSTPPTQGMMAGILKKIKKIPLVYNLQDVFPDSLVNSGLTTKGSLLWKIGRRIEDFSYNSSDRIIVISEGFKKNLLDKKVPKDKIVIISNWVDTNLVKHIERKENKLIDELSLSLSDFIVVYAGNFGAAQGADIILRVAELLRSYSEIKFVIFGGGPYFENAVNYVKDKRLCNVTIRALLPPNRVSEVYSLGDVALITCKTGFGDSGMPSKTWSIMACNTPIVASYDLDSDLDMLLNKSKFGICVKPGDENLLAMKILDTYYSRTNVFPDRDISYLNKYASREVCVSKYVSEISKLVDLE